MRHRLFWKILVAFWAALVLFAGATVLAASLYLEQARGGAEAESPRERLLRHAEAAQRAADEGGEAGLAAWARRVDRREPVPLLLIGPDGADLLGRPVTDGPPARMARRPRAHGDGPWRRLEVRVPDGEVYRLAPDYHGVTLGRVLARPRVIAAPLLLAALAGGLVSLLLARYLTAPLERLRRATEAYAAGDLDTRVAATLGGRRDEITDLARAFDHMAQRVQDLLTAQGRLLRDVSHELRSPLARLQVAVGLARQRGGGGVEGELARIDREAERLNALIGQLLSLARLEGGAPPGARRDVVDLAALVAEVAADADYEARYEGRRVETAVAEPARVEGDAGLLRSALENVVRNAVRHTAAGTAVTVAVDPGSDPGAGTPWWWVTVRDHGPGVPEAMLPRLFDPFVRVDEARDHGSGGTGIGLAIARRAVEAHGGRIEAANATGGGLRVTMTFPAVRACQGRCPNP